MSYLPNANDATIPLDTTDISTAAAEFRALKAFFHTLTTVAASTTPDIFNAATAQINYTGTTTATGFVAALSAGEHERWLYCAGAAVFTAGANLLIDGVTSGNNLVCTAGDILRIAALSTTQFRISKISSTSAIVATATLATTATTATNLLGGTVQGTQLGFQTGAGVGGTVVGTSGAATLNKMTGSITFASASYITTVNTTVVLTNSMIGANDTLAVSVMANSATFFNVQTTIFNSGGAAFISFVSLNSVGPIVVTLNFAVIKGSIN
jgi:hypothetical protein